MKGGDYRVFVRTDGFGVTAPAAAVLEEYFGVCGQILDIYHPAGKPDIAFVTFGSEQEVEAACSEGKADLGGVVCTVTRASARKGGGGGAAYGGPPAHGGYAPPARAAPGSDGRHRVYVTELDTTKVDEEVLKVYFTHFGDVRDVYIPTERSSGVKKPFAFVTMSTADELGNILATAPHTIVEDLTVNVAAAEPKDDGKGGGKGKSAAVPPSYGGPPRAGLSPASTTYSRPAGSPGGAPPAPRGITSAYRPPTAASSYSPAAAVYSPPAAKGSSKGGGGKGRARLFVFGMQEGLNADMLRGHFARDGQILDIYQPPSRPDIAYITFSSYAEVEEAMRFPPQIAGFSVQGMKAAEDRPDQKGSGWKGSSPY
eukprot:TRINITY_DN74367_c0_g1_i1.p1 TRINITY_DN74367_c0_g1~~TRINITY_DN74367_c0_g1_i1.p1  ORF type:complete len:370 (-),score=86.54 TRINITY_DN74367_c0_g1_i1:146-1255(-)